MPAFYWLFGLIIYQTIMLSEFVNIAPDQKDRHGPEFCDFLGGNPKYFACRPNDHVP